MISHETIRYIDIDKVLTTFCQLTGWNSTQGGIWNANFNAPVFDAKYPTNADGHVLQGESKYAFLLRNPDDDLDYGWKGLTEEVESLRPFLIDKDYTHIRLGGVSYVEISLYTIILWLIRRGELEMEDAIYYQTW